MHNLEVWNMVLSKERDLLHRRGPGESRTQQALDEPVPSGRGGTLYRAWRVPNGLRRGGWMWPKVRHEEREPRVAAADTLVTKMS